jgi:hypothetical protein
MAIYSITLFVAKQAVRKADLYNRQHACADNHENLLDADFRRFSFGLRESAEICVLFSSQSAMPP